MSIKHENPWDVQESVFLVYVNQDVNEDFYIEAELEGLCEAAELTVVGSLRQRVDRPTKRSFIGSGKLLELKEHVVESGAEVVIFDCELTGIQARNIFTTLERKVIDRTQLILDIFARRARTREGQLQVELAQLSYSMPRLMSVYTKFERQRGGIGMRGPGETKLESDKRMVRDKIAKLGDEIEDVKKHREQQRTARRKHPFPFCSIVGYTSAGKSTLMNLMSGTDVLADAMPFATLDPTTRKVDFTDGYAFFLTDTVGFIRNLPTGLVAAFRATLEEVTFADFILHIVDVSHPVWDMQRDAVLDTLDALKAGDMPCITVFNKIDAMEDRSILTDLISSTPNSVGISALTSEGIPDLMSHIKVMIQKHLKLIYALVPYNEAGLVDTCYKKGRVLKHEFLENGIYIEAELVDELRSLLERFEVEPRVESDSE